MVLVLSRSERTFSLYSEASVNEDFEIFKIKVNQNPNRESTFSRFTKEVAFQPYIIHTSFSTPKIKYV